MTASLCCPAELAVLLAFTPWYGCMYTYVCMRVCRFECLCFKVFKEDLYSLMTKGQLWVTLYVY